MQYLPPPTWASRANDESGTSTSSGNASATTTLYQDTNPNGANYLDRRHALVGANCMVNSLGGSVAKVISGTSHLDNLVDKDLTNYVSTSSAITVDLALSPSFSIKDLKHTYAANTTAGFVISFSKSLLNLGLVGLPYQIVFYLNGTEQGRVNCTQSSGGLLNLNVLQISGENITCELTAQAPKQFNEIALCAVSGANVDVLKQTNIYYGFVGKNGKYYLDTDLEAFKKAVGYTGNVTVKTEKYIGTLKQSGNLDDSGNLMDNNDKTECKLVPEVGVANEADVILSTDDGTKLIKPGMTVGFQSTSISLAGLAKYSQMRFYQYDNNKYTEIDPSHYGSFSLLGVNLSGSHTDVTRTLSSNDEPCNAFGYQVNGALNVGGTNLSRAFITLAPSIDDDLNLYVSADRSICDEQQSVTLHSKEPVTWECKSYPQGYNSSNPLKLENAEDGLSCKVSNFVYQGEYVFKATAKDGSRRTATTKVTYGVSPIINTAIRPWVNNFTEKGVTYNTDIKAYKEKYEIFSAALLPDITKNGGNLVTPSLDDYASVGGASIGSDQMLLGVIRSSEFKETQKLTVGFVTRTQWSALNLNLLKGLSVKVYNAGAPVDEVSSNNVHFKVLSADAINGQNYVTTEYSVEIDANHPFDAITLWNEGLLGVDISKIDVYYAFVEPSVLAQQYKDNVSQTWQTISHSTTGASIDASRLNNFGVAQVIATAKDLTNIIDDDHSNYATIAGVANVACNNTIAVKLGKLYEGGHQVKIITANEDWLSVNVGDAIALHAYKDGTEVATKTNWSVLDLNVIGGSNNESEILWTPTDEKTKKPVDFDEIGISFPGVAKVAPVLWIYGIQVTNDADGDGIPDVNDDESCDNPYLIDENESELNKDHDYVHGKLNLRRYMKPDLNVWHDGQWFSICLPVDLTFNQFISAFGNKAMLGKPTDFIMGQDGTLVFDIDEVYGNNVLLHKDTPYIIRLGDAQQLEDCDNVLANELKKNNDGIINPVNSVYKIQGVSYDISQNGKDGPNAIPCGHKFETKVPSVTWYGTYKKETSLQKGFYTFTNGILTKYTNRGNEHFRGLRCYMYEDPNATGGNAKPFDVSIFGKKENVTTGIHDIEKDMSEKSGNIYTIGGQLIKENASTTEGLPMGVYIWNNKKVIIK